MPRELTLDLTGDPQVVTISLVRDQATNLIIQSNGTSYRLDISDTAGGEPILEIPSNADVFDLSPTNMVSLVEGSVYFHNIWDFTNPQDPVRLSTGTITCGASITPIGVDYPSLFLQGVAAVVILTQAEYEAITTPDPNTLYVIKD